MVAHNKCVRVYVCVCVCVCVCCVFVCLCVYACIPHHLAPLMVAAAHITTIPVGQHPHGAVHLPQPGHLHSSTPKRGRGRGLVTMTTHTRTPTLHTNRHTCPACDSDPGILPNPPSKFIHDKTNLTALSTSTASSRFYTRQAELM